MKIIKVSNNDNLTRLDIYLTKNLEESRNYISQNIKNGNIKVNSRCVKSGYLIKTDDIIEINELKKDMTIKAEDIPLNVLYEDADIMVVNKKSGIFKCHS